MTDLYIGLMSGTSMDAIDAVLVDLRDTTPVLIATHSHPLPPQMREELIALCSPGENEIDRLGSLDMQLGQLFADAVNQLLSDAKLPPAGIRAIGSHGQTIRHRPDMQSPFTLQLGNPSMIAEQTGITTVADFRSRDIAAGGQGAPLAPTFHQAIFQTNETSRAIINIGGIANVTFLPRDNTPVTGFDCGPGNALLDMWTNKHLRANFDANGEWAAGGKVDQSLLGEMLKDPFFNAPPPKSTGRELFNETWLDKILQRVSGDTSPQDIQASLLELTTRGIVEAIAKHGPKTDEVLICGGGVHNTALMQRLADLLSPCRVVSTADYGVDPDWLEAIAFAWLARQTLSGESGNLPTVTGAHHSVVLGGIYPGSG